LADTCDVCGEPLDDKNFSRCRLCGRKFHMPWSAAANVPKCGRVWFERPSNAMAFACNFCVEEKPELRELLVDTD